MSLRRVQQTLEFALLSPAVVQQILEGRQPGFLSTDWYLRNEVPVDRADPTRNLNTS
jgi:hypothetical protein